MKGYCFILFCFLILFSETHSQECDPESFPMIMEIVFNNATGKRINDIGDMILCQKNSSKKFAMMTLNIGGYVGLCGPRACTIENYTKIGSFILSLFHIENITANYFFPDEVNNISMGAGSIFMVNLAIILVALSLLGTGIDLLWNSVN